MYAEMMRAEFEANMEFSRKPRTVDNYVRWCYLNPNGITWGSERECEDHMINGIVVVSPGGGLAAVCRN